MELVNVQVDYDINSIYNKVCELLVDAKFANESLVRADLSPDTDHFNLTEIVTQNDNYYIYVYTNYIVIVQKNKLWTAGTTTPTYKSEKYEGFGDLLTRDHLDIYDLHGKLLNESDGDNNGNIESQSEQGA